MKLIEVPYRDTQAPNIVLPPNSTDAHCHLFGPRDKYPFSSTTTYQPKEDSGLTEYGALQTALGIGRAVFVNASLYGTDNRVILDAIAQGEGKYRGVANVSRQTTEREYQQLNDGGFRAGRFNFVAHLEAAPSKEDLDYMVGRFKEMGWHADLHFDAKDLRAHQSMLEKFPIDYIIDHMGRVPAKDGIGQEGLRVLLELAKREHFYVKISGAERITDYQTPYTAAIPIAQKLIEAAPGKILWGTDWPHPNLKVMPRDEELVNLLGKITQNDPALLKLILVHNPHRLYQFGN